MTSNITTLASFIKHIKAAHILTIDGYLLLIGEVKDYFINLNGYQRVFDDSKVAFNNVNDVWYFKFIN